MSASLGPSSIDAGSTLRPSVIESLLDQLRAIADDLACIESTSAMWDQIGATEKHLDALGWRFAYQVPAKRLLRVTGAHVIPWTETVLSRSTG